MSDLIPILRVTFPDQTVWYMRAETLARQRATHFVEGDIARGETQEADRESEIAGEIAYALYNTPELLSWAKNTTALADIADDLHIMAVPIFQRGTALPQVTDYTERDWASADLLVLSIRESDLPPEGLCDAGSC